MIFFKLSLANHVEHRTRYFSCTKAQNNQPSVYPHQIACSQRLSNPLSLSEPFNLISPALSLMALRWNAFPLPRCIDQLRPEIIWTAAFCLQSRTFAQMSSTYSSCDNRFRHVFASTKNGLLIEYFSRINQELILVHNFCSTNNKYGSKHSIVCLCIISHIYSM